MQLKERILAKKKEVDEAQKIYSEQYLKIKAELYRVQGPIEQSHKELLEKFRRHINNQLEEEHTSCCCRADHFDEAWFTEDGITMRIDADHPNDICERDWSWTEVESVLVPQPN